MLALLVLAYSSPPDPTWLGGFWDDGDGDDAILLITTTPTPPPPAFVTCRDPHWTTVWLIPIADEPPPVAATPAAHPSRGPPLS
jgi:hypothetical protein